jgi:hypothetical protein
MDMPRKSADAPDFEQLPELGISHEQPREARKLRQALIQIRKVRACDPQRVGVTRIGIRQRSA